MKKILPLLSILSLLVLGCSSTEKSGAHVGTQLETNDYSELVQKNTQHSLKYDGFYNKFEIYATFLNSELQSALLQKKSDTYQWNAQQAQKEREKMFQENSTQTKMAISFYTPSMRLNDLNKKTSIWKIYLEANGERFEGTAIRNIGTLEDIQALYPYHNRWSIAYDVVFNAPLSSVEKSNVKLILTSTQGQATLNF